jgi:hypothetical protein
MTEIKLPVCSWEQVSYWRERLENADEYPVLSGLESCWSDIDSQSKFIERNEDDQIADNPFAAFFYYVDAGCYPPPEILLAMLEAFEVYCGVRGDISLEEVFFGPPVKRAGNYAAKHDSKMNKIKVHFKFLKLLHEGKSRTEAAEIISNELDGKPEPESILRSMRNISLKNPKKTEK